ncbi:MAG: aminoacyl-tRNA hydrolase [Thermodesulfobacteriota bacterium]
MKLIAGLGNPGRRYSNTRHNIGFMLVDLIADTHNISLKQRGFDAVWGRGKILFEDAILVKPQTFMNRSGFSLKGFVKHFNLSLEDLLIVYDDVDLPFEKLRIKTGGGAGGHKGIVSVIEVLGDNSFPRMRLGIGRPEYDDVVRYVLSPFTAQEKVSLKSFLERAKAAFEVILKDDIKEAMNEFNSVK